MDGHAVETISTLEPYQSVYLLQTCAMHALQMGFEMTQTGEVIYLVDDDSRVRDATSELLASLDLDVITFESAAEYLDYSRSDTAACLILDLQLPGINGLDLQRQLADKDCPPIIFISGHSDVPSTVRAMKAGAVEFLTKPLDPPALISAIDSALTRDRKRRKKTAELAPLLERFSHLTPRERDVFPLLVEGLLNKQAAAVLDITEVTLQIHRGHIMRKMAAQSFADLVRMAVKLRIPHSY
jgi:FixJ family two-component response regulator